MAVIIANGCWDVFHQGHQEFLCRAKSLGIYHNPIYDSGDAAKMKRNVLIVCVNSDESAKRLKRKKWGDRYPIDDVETRMANVMQYADRVAKFDTEQELREFIKLMMPCILVKGPDYAGKPVTGDDIAPVLILDVPEPESVKQMKREVYGVNVCTKIRN